MSELQDADMASGFCDNCRRLLTEFAVNVRKACRELESKLQEGFRETGRCACFGIPPDRRGTAAQELLLTLQSVCGKSISFVCGQCCGEKNNNTSLTDWLCEMKFAQKITDYITHSFVIIIYAHYLCVCLFSDDETQLLSQESLKAVNTLSASEHTDLQMTAAMYYLHLSHHCE